MANSPTTSTGVPFQEQRYDPKLIAEQLSHPSGELGLRVGNKMNETNWFMTELTYDLMELTPEDRVLEIGIGNGKLMDRLIRSTRFVAGLDRSETMLAEAAVINEEAVRSGTLELRQGTVEALPYPDASFDKVCSINTLYFWQDPVATLAGIKRVLVPPGRVFLAIRTREVMASRPFFQHGFTHYSTEEVHSLLSAAGFEEIGSVHQRQPDSDFDILVAFGTSYQEL